MKPSLRRRVIEEWRGLPERGSAPDRSLAVKDILQTLAPQLGLAGRLQEEEIIGAWGEIVGEFFWRHSRPFKLHQQVLTVRVLQPTILFELERQWKPLILSKLKQRFGARTIREVHFRLG